MKILVVDDEEVIVLGIIKKLSQLSDIPTTLVGAYSGEEALQVMENFIPDLLITDISMAPMDGLELISLTRAKGLCDHYIILTAYESFAYARQALQYQVMDYLLKPIDWSVLERHVRELAMKSDQQTRIAQVIGQYSHLFADLSKEDFSPTVKKLVRYINKNYSREISLSQLSVYNGLSENSICNLFKKELGITFLDYLYELRLKRAMELLLADNSPTVREIALKIGYSSERQFFRVFKNRTGYTPQQFREKHA